MSVVHIGRFDIPFWAFVGLVGAGSVAVGTARMAVLTRWVSRG